MVLPLLGSFLGSALLPSLAGTGAMSFLANPVAAGAIGSGIGSLLQGDSLDEAIGTGLTSYFGGKLLGGLAKPVATSATAGTDTATRALQKGFEPFAKEGFGAKLMVPEKTLLSFFKSSEFPKSSFRSLIIEE